MTRIALYPGSFDPPTRGHEDLIRRSLALCDHLIVAVAINSSKQPLFTVEERLDLLRRTVGVDGRVTYETFDGLLVDFARARGATMVVRGLRAVSDFDYEFQMAQLNRHLAADVETVYLPASPKYSFVSSSGVREVAAWGGSVDDWVPAFDAEALRARRPRGVGSVP